MCGTAAVALDTCNGNFMVNHLSINEINKITFVITVNFKVSGRYADRAGFKFRPEKWHEPVKK